MRVRFSGLAEIEFDEANTWYRCIRPELGRAFTAEVRTVTQRLAHIPLMYSLEIGDVRRCVLRRFPYTLRYAVRGDLIVVLAVSHKHRAPDYWIDRVRD